MMKLSRKAKHALSLALTTYAIAAVEVLLGLVEYRHVRYLLEQTSGGTVPAPPEPGGYVWLGGAILLLGGLYRAAWAKRYVEPPEKPRNVPILAGVIAGAAAFVLFVAYLVVLSSGKVIMLLIWPILGWAILLFALLVLLIGGLVVSLTVGGLLLTGDTAVGLLVYLSEHHVAAGEQ